MNRSWATCAATLAASLFVIGAGPARADEPAASASAGLPSAAPATAAPPLPNPAPCDRAAKDWAGLCRYRDANRRLGAERRPDAVFLGDSITEGWGAIGSGASAGRWVNRGISGQTSPQMLLRLPQDVIALRPRVLHLMAGTNDIAGNTGPFDETAYRDTIRSIVTLARANGIAVVLASIPPSDRFDWNPALQPARTIVTQNDWLRRYAAEAGATFVDYHAALRTPEDGLRTEYGPDRVHPNAAGYAVMQPLTERAIERALAARDAQPHGTPR